MFLVCFCDFPGLRRLGFAPFRGLRVGQDVDDRRKAVLGRLKRHVQVPQSAANVELKLAARIGQQDQPRQQRIQPTMAANPTRPRLSQRPPNFLKWWRCRRSLRSKWPFWHQTPQCRPPNPGHLSRPLSRFKPERLSLSGKRELRLLAV